MSEHITRTKYIDLSEPGADPTWPSRREDLLAALTIMDDYETRTGKPLRLIEGWREGRTGRFGYSCPPGLSP